LYQGAETEKAVLEPIQDEDPIRRRLQPKCKEDVRLLFSELNLWRKKKLDEIEQRRDITSETRIKMRSKVLSQEVILLRKINWINHRLTLTAKKKEVDELLCQMITPQYWKVSSGEEIEIQTTEMDQSSELIEIYQLLDESNVDQTVSQRIRILDQVKDKLRDRSCPLVKEICGLVDREKEFLRRGIRQSLSGLRARISHLFLHFLERNINALDINTKQN